MKKSEEGKPPFLGSWSAVYGLMAAVLVLLIVLFYLFTKHFQ